MTLIQDHEFPTDVKYIYIEPISLYWVRLVTNGGSRDKISVELGFTELLTKNLKKHELKFTFRTESLSLRHHKPFLRLLTRNKMFEFLSPWKCDWQINPEIKDNEFTFLDYPYKQYVLRCFNIQKNDAIEDDLKSLNDLKQDIERIISKEMFKDCKDCPDFFESTVTRRSQK